MTKNEFVLVCAILLGLAAAVMDYGITGDVPGHEYWRRWQEHGAESSSKSSTGCPQ